MCFSATASFVAGGALCLIGIATLGLVKSRHDAPFASIPLLFGIQQLVEGAVWLALGDGDARSASLAAPAYTFFSHVLWPAFVPFAVLVQEPPGRRRTLIMALLALGLLVAVGYAAIIALHGVSVRVAGHSLVYDVPSTVPWLHAFGYVAATCGSCVASSRRWIAAFGVASALSAAVAYPFYREAFASVWCFFAAALSAFVFLHFWAARRAPPALAAPS